MIGITVGVFFTGIAIGCAIWANIYGPGIMFRENQQMSSLMMQSPELRQQMMNSFMKNPQLLREMFSDPQFMQEMMKDQQFNQMMMSYMMQNPAQVDMWMTQNLQHIPQITKTMKENHAFMQEMMIAIINDPDLRLQMLGHMSENQEAMQQMRQMIQVNMTGSGMMMGGK